MGKADKMIGYSIIALAFILTLFALLSYLNGPVLQTPAQEYETIITGTASNDDVEIALTPSFQGNLLVVSSVFNTHSVDLSQFDLQQLVLLEYDGAVIEPVRVFSLRGHHGSGQMIFKGDQTPNSFTITIAGIPQIQKRVYQW